MTPRAVIHPRPAALIERDNRRWGFHRVSDPVGFAIPTYRIEARK